MLLAKAQLHLNYAYVTYPYQAAYSDPITMGSGEALLFEGKEDNWYGWTWLWCTNQQGKSGWVPQSYVLQGEEGCVAGCDYDARELSVQAGDLLKFDLSESGWLRCIDQAGRSGWVPVRHVIILPTLLLDEC